MKIKTIGLIGPSDPKISNRKKLKTILEQIAEIFLEKNYSVILSPDKKSTAENFAKIYKKKGGRKLIGISYKDDRIGGYSGLNRQICDKNIDCKTYELQPGVLIRESNDLVCVGLSNGVFWELCMIKYCWSRRKNSRVYVIKELVKDTIPKEIKKFVSLKFISINELKKLI